MTQERQDLITELREAAIGKQVWRVRLKETKAYCIEFERWEEPEARQWWKENSEQSPDHYASYELVLVRVQTKAEKLMLRAAKHLEVTNG